MNTGLANIYHVFMTYQTSFQALHFLIHLLLVTPGRWRRNHGHLKSEGTEAKIAGVRCLVTSNK